MNCWQIIYNASPSGINGTSGFGVRTATVNIPKEILERVGRDSSLMSYISGTFKIPNEAKVLFEYPERIYEWPRRYFYKEVPLSTDKMIYVLGRSVYAGFDHSFYSTKLPSRTGNFIVHVFIFDQKPGKDIFSLLQEKSDFGMSSFFPMDYKPSLDNHQMTYLMTGKPEILPQEDFIPQKWSQEISPEAFDVFFEYRESVISGKPLAVKIPAEKAADTCAGLMSLLPSHVASDTTFEINHQLQGLSTGAKITFINEYYQHVVSPLTCHLLDCNAGHIPSKFEDQYRELLEKAIASADMTTVKRLTSWIWSDIACENIDSSQELNLSLFNFSQNPDNFCLDDIRNIPELLPVLKRWIDNDTSKRELLTSLLSSAYKKADSSEDFINMVELCEIVRKAGISTDTVIRDGMKLLTDYAVDRPSLMARILDITGIDSIKKYIDLKECAGRTYILDDVSMKKWWSRTFMYFWPRPYDVQAILKKMLSQEVDTAQIKEVLSVIEPSPSSRVTRYTDILKEDTSHITILMPLLEWDQKDTDKVNFYDDFKESHSNEAFASLFYRQLVINFPSEWNISVLMAAYSELCRKNPRFSKMLFGRNEGIEVYSRLLNRMTASRFRQEDYATWAKLIQNHVLNIIPDTVQIKTDWYLLRKIFLNEKPERNMKKYYDLAVKLKAPSAISTVAAEIFEKFETIEEVKSFISTLRSHKIMNDGDIIGHARRLKHENIKSLYVAALAKHSDYQSIAEVAEKLYVKDIKSFVKTFFPDIYKSERKKEIAHMIKSFFQKLFKKNKEEVERKVKKNK